MALTSLMIATWISKGCGPFKFVCCGSIRHPDSQVGLMENVVRGLLFCCSSWSCVSFFLFFSHSLLLETRDSVRQKIKLGLLLWAPVFTESYLKSLSLFHSKQESVADALALVIYTSVNLGVARQWVRSGLVGSN